MSVYLPKDKGIPQERQHSAAAGGKPGRVQTNDRLQSLPAPDTVDCGPPSSMNLIELPLRHVMAGFGSKFPGIAAALARLWTQNLAVAFLIVIVAYLIMLVPAAVKFIETRVTTNATFYQCFVASIDEILLAILAITVLSVLNYFEGGDGKGRSPGRMCAGLTIISFLCTVITLVAYFLAHFLGKAIFDPQTDTGTFVYFTICFALISIFFSMTNILQARREKDRLEEYEQ